MMLLNVFINESSFDDLLWNSFGIATTSDSCAIEYIHIESGTLFAQRSD